MALSLAKTISQSLQKLADPTIAVGKKKYFKGVCEFHGIKTPVANKALKLYLPSLQQLYESHGRPGIHELCKTLMASKFHEEKCAVPFIMKSVLDKKPSQLGLVDVDFLGKEVFRTGIVFDWATVDTLSGQVLHYALINDGNHSNTKVSQTLVEWASNSASPLWQQRASCVAYVKLAKHGNHTDDIIKITDLCVKNQERFVQLGVGWVLRELWLAEPQLVVDFIVDRYSNFSREGLRYAIEKMDSQLQTKLLKFDPTSGARIKVHTAEKNPKAKSTSASLSGSRKRAKEESGDEDEEFQAPKSKKFKK